MKRVLLLVAALVFSLPSLSHAWWNADWSGRTKIVLDPAAQGPGAAEALGTVPVLVRLHTGNFQFVNAQVDGKDLRFVAGDDTTPLKFQVEQFDGLNELALIWVAVPGPLATAGPDKPFIWMYYGNETAPGASEPKGVYDASYTAVLHFNEKTGPFADSTAYAQAVAATGVVAAPAGIADGGASFPAGGRITLAAAPSLAVSRQGFTFGAWVKPGESPGRATLVAQGADGFRILYEAGQLWVAEGEKESARSALAPGAWHHVVVSVGDETAVYVDGVETSRTPTAGQGYSGDVVIGDGFVGEMDELSLSNVSRPAAWVAAVYGAQKEASTLVQVNPQGEAGEGDDEGVSYFRILLGAVTVDGWVVIVILMVMMVISFAVMATKAVFLSRTDRANKVFQGAFSNVGADLLALDVEGNKGRHASLMRLYATAAKELRKRVEGPGATTVLSAQSIDAIRASLDANVVRENARLNSQMVLLTIAISGGPFLGLLGTVVGVMITFAAIAAVGDVNVNSIAPGIAAALVATVAGLGVAIPALFGYNYLASRIKNISADMQVFVDEIVSRIAERYAP